MPTLAELLLALITDQPLSKEEKWEVARHVLRLMRHTPDTTQPPPFGGRGWRMN